jgi:phage-related protein (TIGR01555 family)
MADKLDLAGISNLPVPVASTAIAPFRADGWKNALSGMGTKRDKRRYTNFDFTYLIDSKTLSFMYMGDGLTTRIVDTFADDMTREWGRAENDPISEGKTQGTIEAEFARLEVSTCINQAKKWARLHGGALIFIGAFDGQDPSKELKPDKVKAIEFLKIIELPDILTYDCTYNMDKRSSEYGKIEQYAVQIRIGNTWEKLYIHASRCIPFFGQKIPSSLSGVSPDARYWGISKVQPVIDYLRDFSGAMGAVSSILLEFIIGKYKFSDLDEMLAKGGEDRLKTRVESIDMTKSTIHSVILGTDEEYSRDSATVTGIADLLDRFMMNLSAVTQYPVTKLFGRSPAGMNATGENDLKNYYDAVRSEQVATTKYIQNLVNLIANLKNIEGEFPWVWNPLFQLSEKDQGEVKRLAAEESRTYADGDERMLNAGVLMPEDVWKLRFEKILGKRTEDFFAQKAEEELEQSIERNIALQKAAGKTEGGNGKTDPESGNKKVPKNAE